MDVDDALTVYLRTLLLTPGVERTTKRTSEQQWCEVQKVVRDAVQRMKRRSRRLRCLDQIVDEVRLNSLISDIQYSSILYVYRSSDKLLMLCIVVLYAARHVRL